MIIYKQYTKLYKASQQYKRDGNLAVPLQVDTHTGATTGGANGMEYCAIGSYGAVVTLCITGAGRYFEGSICIQKVGRRFCGNGKMDAIMLFLYMVQICK